MEGVMIIYPEQYYKEEGSFKLIKPEFNTIEEIIKVETEYCFNKYGVKDLFTAYVVPFE